MKKLALMLLACLSLSAHAESFLQMEAGLGAEHSVGEHDGIWVQDGLPHIQKLTAPAYMAGLTGEVWRHEKWSVSYHMDYLYLADNSVSAMAVDDAHYNLQTQIADGSPRTRFSGHGHTQGIALTLAPGYSWKGWRFNVEAGAFCYWAAWHETVYTATPFHADHKTAAAVTWIAGASVSRGPFALRYLYFNKSQSWNPYPQYTSGAHILMLTYRF